MHTRFYAFIKEAQINEFIGTNIFQILLYLYIYLYIF